MILRARVDVDSATCLRNREQHREEWERVAAITQAHAEGGSRRAAEQHAARGRMSARKRVAALLDRDTPFIEFSALAGHGLYESHEACPGGGVITGIGMVRDRPVAVVANDPTVKGGSYFPITLKKHLRLQEIARAFRLPCVYLVDSGGAYLPMQDEVFPDRDHFGRIFFNMARMSAEGLPQLSVVLGRSTAGGAYVPAMSDEVVMVRGSSAIYLAGPPLVEAATGEVVSDEDLGGADVHCRLSGVADHMAADEAAALSLMRELVDNLAYTANMQPPHPPEPPLRSPDELAAVVPAHTSTPYDPREILARVLDAGRFSEFKALYGTSLVCGFARVMGFPLGVLANHGPLDAPAALKASHFVQMADQRGVPLLFLQNIPGFLVGRQHESAGIARDGAKMVRAVANARVPKITVVVGGSHGAGNYGMCGRAFDPHLLFLWPSARVSVMSGEAAATVLASIKGAQMKRRGEPVDGSFLEDIRQSTLEAYQRMGDATYGSARLWDDGVIAPQDTRNVLGLALAALAGGVPSRPSTPFGVYRM